MIEFHHRVFVSFEKYGINLQYIESRVGYQHTGDYEFYIECDNDKHSLPNAVKELDQKSKYLHVLPHVDNILDQPGL